MATELNCSLGKFSVGSDVDKGGCATARVYGWVQGLIAALFNEITTQIMNIFYSYDSKATMR